MQHDDVARKARWRLRIAAVLASGVTSLGIVIGYLGVVEAIRVGGPQAPSLGEALVGPLFGALGAAYLIWACYWGIPAVWGKWRTLVASLSQTGCVFFVNPGTLLIMVLLFFYIPVVGGYLYGVFGGGIYEYWKCRQFAVSPG